MAGVRISALPVIPSAPALTDIFPEVQPAVAGTTYKTTFAQLLALFQPNIPLTNAGNPNGLVAGTVYQFLWDTTNSVLYVCTTTGNAVAAVWTAAGSFAIPLAVTKGGTGLTTTTINQILYSSALNTIAGLATNNSSVLVTSAGGVPSLSTVIPSGVTMANDPTTSLGIATKQYVDQTALNGTSVYAASAASLGAVAQSGAGVGATLTNAGAQATFALDGVNPPVGSNVLIKNTAAGMTAANEGIYTVTSVGSGASNWILTRATSYDTTTEINNTGLIVIQNGSTLAATAWYNAATIVTVDTTNFSYSQFGAAKTFSTKVTTFTTGTNTFTPASGSIGATIELVGSGGSAGGVVQCANAGAGSSGSGAGYANKYYTAALIGANATVVIGASVNGGAAGNNNGVAGNNSTFTPAGAGVVLTASGGGKGYAGSNAVTNAFTATAPDAPGTGTNGDLNISGSYGTTGQGLTTSAIVPQSGACFWGLPLYTVLSGGGPYNGSNGQGFGSGGSAGVSIGNTAAASGGNSAPGYGVITEYIMS